MGAKNRLLFWTLCSRSCKATPGTKAARSITSWPWNASPWPATAAVASSLRYILRVRLAMAAISENDACIPGPLGLAYAACACTPVGASICLAMMLPLHPTAWLMVPLPAARPRSGNAHIAAAYLLDPVDNTPQTPESAAYPSAAKALARCGRAVGISGAAQTGNCNPEGSSSRVRCCEWLASGPWAVVLSGIRQVLEAQAA